MLSRLRVPAFFVFVVLWFAAFQPWGGFVDPDAFYHAKMAQLIFMHGPLHTFPWLDLTSLGSHFADQHFLFHVLLVPFVRFFGMLPGTQIATVVFAVMFSAIFYWAVRYLKISYPIIWTLLALASPSLFVRLSLGKASPLALSWFVVGLVALARRSPWLVFLASAGFALTHGGWLVLLGCQGLFLLGEILYDKVVADRRWGEALTASPWRSFVWSCGGVLAGLILHPNARALPSFLWVQVVQVALLTPTKQIMLGMEWYPPGIAEMVAAFCLFVMLALVLCFGFLFARRSSLNAVRAKQVIAFALPVAVLLAFSFKSRRFVEYTIPVLTLWCAVLATFIDWRRLRQEFLLVWHEHLGGLSKFSRQILASIFCILLFSVFLRGEFGAYHALHASRRSFDQWSRPMAVLQQQARPGNRVYNLYWDEFPQLFALNDAEHYVSGLDPTFLLAASSTQSEAYTHLAFDAVSSTEPYQVIRQLFGAEYLFLDKQRRPDFATILETDPRFHVLYDDNDARLYRLETER